MLSARAILQEIRNDRGAIRLFLSVAARGEEQGGWENECLAALTPNTELAEKIKRHGADEHKHSRFFSVLLKKRELPVLHVSPDLDYIIQLTNAGMGVSHERLRSTQNATDHEIIRYLAHGRVTEQRGMEAIHLLVKFFKDDPELAPGLAMVADDEINHPSHCMKNFSDSHEKAMEKPFTECSSTIR